MGKFSEEMVETTLKIIDRMFYNEEKITFYSVAEKGKVSRQFLYNHEEIKAKISYYQNFNSLSVEERFTLLKSQNQELINCLSAYDDYILKSFNKSQIED